MRRQGASIIPEDKGFRKGVVMGRLVNFPSDVHYVLFRRSFLPEMWLIEVQSHIKHGSTTTLKLFVLLSYLHRYAGYLQLYTRKKTCF